MLVGKEAEQAGKNRRLWKITQTVYWKGEKISLFSDELQELIDRAYIAMFNECPSFRQALLDAKKEKLIHSLGAQYINQTILTEYHFIRRLEILRSQMSLQGL